MELRQRNGEACGGLRCARLSWSCRALLPRQSLPRLLGHRIEAFNGNFRWAGWFIMFAGILGMLDGRVARLSGTGARFGAEGY